MALATKLQTTKTPLLDQLHDTALCAVALALRSVVICYAVHSDIRVLWRTCSVV